MRFFTHWPLGNPPKPGHAGNLNLWRQWVSYPKGFRWFMSDADVLRFDEIRAIKAWSHAQLEWGLHIRLHNDALSGLPQVIEVYGPDLIEPHVILYRRETEIQVDGTNGEGRRFDQISEALHFVGCYA